MIILTDTQLILKVLNINVRDDSKNLARLLTQINKLVLVHLMNQRTSMNNKVGSTGGQNNKVNDSYCLTRAR